MKTIIIDIINDKALTLLRDLELLQLIRVRQEKTEPNQADWANRYKGAMTKQSISDIDAQLNELRSGWE